MRPTIEAPELVGRRVRLEPLEAQHGADLATAAAQDRRSYGYTVVPSGREALDVYVEGLLAARSRGDVLPYAQVRLGDGRAVGVTTFLNLRVHPGSSELYAVEIGGTWLSDDAQRSGVNTEAKLLLITHAFEVWTVGRVDFKTDSRNERSRRAIEGLGANFEGVLRSWQPSQVVGEESKLRDTAMYSITASQWPAVRAGLEARRG